MKNICVIGVGYVGLVTGTCFADLGNRVTALDINEERIQNLKNGFLPIYEPGLEEMVKRNVAAGRLSFTTDYAEALQGAEFAFIAVGTPEGVDGEADLQYVRAAAESIAEHMTAPLIIVNKSTVPVGTGDWVAEVVSAKQSRPVPFNVVSCPEFLREGSAIADFMSPARTVLGSLDRDAANKVADLHLPLRAPIQVVDLRTAEMIKYASNAFLATKISFINEIANICEALGADVKEVAAGMGFDPRIGRQFLDAGLGYGGSCFEANETVFVLDAEGAVQARPIAEVFARYPHTTQAGVDVARPDGLRALAFDLETGRPAAAPVSVLTRRWYDGAFVTLETRMGRRLTVTADHPVVVYDRDSQAWRTVLAREVRAGDCLMAATQLAPLPQPAGINVLAAVAQHDRALAAAVRLRVGGDALAQARPAALGHIPANLMAFKYDFGRTPFVSLALYEHLAGEGVLPALSPEAAALSTARGAATEVPGYLPLDEGVLRLLGYYAAEGWITRDTGRDGAVRDRVGFTFHVDETDYIADLHATLARLGIKHDVRVAGKAHTTKVSSRVLAFLLRDELGCGTRSENKRLPHVVLNLAPALRLAYLQGVFSGDGSVTPTQGGRNVFYEYATVSRALADGLLLVLQSLGVVASLRQKWMNKSKRAAYIIRISGLEQLEALKTVFGARRQAAIERILAGYQRRIAQSGFGRRETFATLAVTRVSVEERAEYVYSLETGTHSLLANSGLVCHNCFPKDVKALAHMANVQGRHPQLLQAVMDINHDQRRLVVNKVRELLGTLEGKTIALLGLAFKPNTDDMRDAPSIEIAQMLQAGGARVKGYDPVAMVVAGRHMPNVSLCEDAYEVATGADALIICTEWNEFKQLDLARLKRSMRQAVVVDGRNIYDPAQMQRLGFQYRGIGRGYNGDGNNGHY